MFGEIYDIDRYVEASRIREHCGDFEEKPVTFIVQFDFIKEDDNGFAIFGLREVSFSSLAEARAFLNELISSNFARYAVDYPSANKVTYDILKCVGEERYDDEVYDDGSLVL